MSVTESMWNNYKRQDFTIDGIKAIIVSPNSDLAPGKPWFWRARFFGAFPNADLALLQLGWTVAHINIDELYGSPESNRRFDLLYKYMTDAGYSRFPILVGYSRGGLDVYSWARLHPTQTAGLYLDNAVCDFKSWPGGKGKGPGNPGSWQNCLNAWGFTEQQALEYPDNPVDNLTVLAEAKIPILHVTADADETVPASENSDLVEAKYCQLGGEITVIHKPECKHHPHCLENPQPIVDFCVDAFRKCSPRS